MRKYETFFIVDPDIPDETVTAVDNKFKAIVTSNGGDVLSYSPWGKRKLAYPIRKRSRGLYILMEFAGEAPLVAELERNQRLDERILKFITVKLEDRFDPEKERERIAAAEAAAEAAVAATAAAATAAAAAAAAAVPAPAEDEEAEKPADSDEEAEGEETSAAGEPEAEPAAQEAEAAEEEAE